jgi:hypothetical protein
MVAKTAKSDKGSPERDEHHKLVSHHEQLTAQGDQTDRTRYAFRDKQFKASAATQKRDVPRLYSVSPANPATRGLQQAAPALVVSPKELSIKQSAFQAAEIDK